jgi:SPP1 family predicted phage head-tail adaptor
MVDILMGSGKYNKRIAVQVVTETNDDYLSKTTAWATNRHIWCSIKPLSGYEKLQAGAISSGVSHRIKTRYDSVLSVKNRLLWNSRTFKIQSIININEANKELELMTIEDT